MTEANLARGQRDRALDGLRAVAALLVVFYHCGVELRLPPLVFPGYSGVHLFFVLSGYLIARPFFARMMLGGPFPSWRRYAVRRIVRIYPTYLLALAVFVAMRCVGRLHVPTTADVVQHALLVFNFAGPAQFLAINIVMWTLAIEAQFYVLLPIASALLHPRPDDPRPSRALMVVVAFTLLGLVSRALELRSSNGSEVAFRLPFSFLDLFGAGMAVAYLQLGHGRFLQARRGLRRALLVVATTLILAANFWQTEAGGGDWLRPPSVLLGCAYPLLVSAGFAMVLLAVLTRKRADVPILTSKPLVFVGEISYSMYLFHVGVGYFLLTRLPGKMGTWLGAHPLAYSIVQMGPVLLVSYAVYLLVERPSLRWVERYSGREQA